MNLSDELILLIVLAIGLLFQRRTYPYLITYRYMEWSERASETSVFGLLILSAAVCMAKVMEFFWPGVFLVLPGSPNQPYIVPAIIFVFLFYFVSRTINNIFISGSKKTMEALMKHGDPVDVILTKAFTENHLVRLLFKNSNILIGWVQQLPDPRMKERVIFFIPLFTGSTDLQKSEFTSAKNYGSVYAERIKKGKFVDGYARVMAVYLTDLQSIDLFDFDFEEELKKGSMPKKVIYEPKA